MHGKSVVQLGGKPVQLWFNNFSKVEMAKWITPKLPVDTKEETKEPKKGDEVLLIEAIDSLARENHLLLLKNIIYCGIVGQAYGTDKAIPMTREQIAEQVATADFEQLYDVWYDFMDAMGFNLPPLKGQERKKKRKTNP